MSLDRLNEKQREAAMRLEGPMLILAGAGSGKTGTMTERIAYMIDQGISPYNILAVTFTNKAAAEMRQRVEALVGECSEMWIMTFHAMCLRILHMHCDVIGYDSNFIIYDGTDQKTVVKNISKAIGINEKEFSPAYLLSAISNTKEKGKSPEDLENDGLTTYKDKVIHQVYAEYEKELHKNNAMDFDDLLLNTVRLFETDEFVLEKYRNRFKYVMVDEYQDTNHIQYKIIKMLAEKHHNLCVVGDDDQCIYQWRGADIRNILDFEKDFPDTKVIKLEQNYRSTGNIIAAAHSVIVNNHDRKSKKLWTEKEAGDKVKYYRADTGDDEARYVAQEISLLKGRDRKYSDFAILYRMNAQSRLFEKKLTERGIPYRVLSGLRYFDRKEIKDMMAYMRLVVNPHDNLSLKRIINEPKRGMGEKTVDKLETLANVRGESILEALFDEEVLETLPGRAAKSVGEMAMCLNYCIENKETLTVGEIYDNLLENTGYLKALEDQNTVEAEGRIENLLEFKTEINEEMEAGEMKIGDFVERIALLSDIDNHDENQDAVVLMTMHSAKGLEFPVVFMPGMEDGIFPGHKAFDSEDKMEEERRLCYVGMTRAKETLILTGAEMRTMYGRTDFMRESQFMREVDKKLIDGDAVYVKKQGTGGPGVSTGSFDGFSSGSSSKPYDALKYSRAATKANSSMPKADLNVGDRVKHAKFGEGLIVEADAKTVVVIFDTEGRKKMAKSAMHLKKIGD